MAHLSTRCSSSVMENPEANDMRENIPPRPKTPTKREYLYEEYFPDLTLLDLTNVVEEFSLLENKSTPLTARTTVRKPDESLEITNNNSKVASFLTPRMEVKAASQPCNLNSNVSMIWLQDECLPNITDYSIIDSVTQQTMNFTINITASDMQLLNHSEQKSNLEPTVPTLTLDDSTCKTSKPPCVTSSQISFPENQQSTSNDKGPTVLNGPSEQVDLPSGNTALCKTSVTSDINRTISRPAETSLNNAQLDTCEARPQSNNTITLSESSCNGSHHNTFDANPPQSNGTMSEIKSGGSHHSTFEMKLPAENDGIMTLSDSISSDHQHNTFDENPPNQSKISSPMSQKGSNDSLHNTFDAQPFQSSSKINFDDTLNSRYRSVATSTPLISCKMGSCAWPDESKILLSQEKPDGDTASEPDDQAPLNVPSNIRGPETFQLATKLHTPSSKPPLLLKSKLPTLLPERGKMPPSGLPVMKRCLPTRTRQESSTVSSSYNRPPPTTASRQNTQRPKTTVEKLQLGRRSVSSTAMNVLQTRKRDLNRDVQAVVKKTKTDVPTSTRSTAAPEPSVNSSAMKSLRQDSQCQQAPTTKTQKNDAEVSSAAGDAVTKTNNLKLPGKSRRSQLAKGSGCANCKMLVQQLKAEIQSLKEELQRHKDKKDS